MKTIKFLLIAIAAGFVITACNNSSEADKVAVEIENGTQLSKADYTVLIDYLGEFAEKAQNVQDKINNLPFGDVKAANYEDELDKLRKEYDHLELFGDVLKKASQEELGADNVALVNKYAGYEWFDSPDWAQINTNSEAAGIEVEMPDSDTTGVVAGAVDELQIKE